MYLGSQIFITESCYWLTGPIKPAKNAHNTGSCAWRELAAAAWVLPFRGENAGHAAPALRLSLRHSPLVNGVASRLTVTTPARRTRRSAGPPRKPADRPSALAGVPFRSLLRH